MPQIAAAYRRDANSVPITTDGLTTSTEMTCVGSNNTTSTPIFTITGAVEIRAFWGVVTQTLQGAHTAAFITLNDQTATVDITLATGVTLSAEVPGCVIVKKGLVGAALVKLDNGAGVVSEPTTLETTYFSPFVIVKKTAATTQIEYSYATTNVTPTGKIQFFVRWLPLSEDGDVAAV